MQSQYAAPKGTRDILPQEAARWEKLEAMIRALCRAYGYKEIRTPEFEHTELFVRGVGDTTDIVQKEMYTFTHRGKESFTLKPEGTAPIVRAYIENGMGSDPQPVKLFYLTRCFRCENPQKGRQRQFNQFGIEAIGSASPAMDAEVISVAHALFKRLGLDGISLEINSVGCPECRSRYYEVLTDYLTKHEEALCADCRARMKKNPMRVLDCKKESCRRLIADAPKMKDHLCAKCAAHFEQVQSYLSGAHIDFTVNPSIVRGLDYYTNTAFEFIAEKDLGAQATVCGGGRYDGLIGMLGGEETPGVGFGMGIERLMLILENRGFFTGETETADLYVAPLGQAASKMAFGLAVRLRENGLSVQTDMMERSLKAQMKYADKIGARHVLIIGQDEIEKGRAVLRDMRTKAQTEVDLNGLSDNLTKILCETEDKAK
jgi:histidyl-tRNA synthetase